MCTRVLWSDNGVATVVARTMDWPDSTFPIITVLPRGMKSEGIWVDLLEFDLAKGGQVKALNPDNIEISGNVNGQFINAEAPF